MNKLLATTAALLALSMSQANAGVIVSAQSATILNGAPGEGSIASTHDQYGLLSAYGSGVDDFDDYIAQSPRHAFDFEVSEGSVIRYNEWFTLPGVTSAVVSYDLGSVQQTVGMALWNEDANGTGKLNILGSTDGLSWIALGTSLSPTDNAYKFDYGPDVFAWGLTSTRYIKLEMSLCPTSEIGRIGCSIGEVAFNVTAVPEPSTLATLSLGLTLLGWVAARRRG
jgi:hypothetical protein